MFLCWHQKKHINVMLMGRDGLCFRFLHIYILLSGQQQTISLLCIGSKLPYHKWLLHFHIELILLTDMTYFCCWVIVACC